MKRVLYLQGQRPTKWSLAPAGCWRWPPATFAKELGLECATSQVGLMELVQCEGFVSGYDPPFSYFLHLLWGVSAPREAALTDGRTELAKQEGRWGNLGSPCRSLQWFSEPWAYFFWPFCSIPSTSASPFWDRGFLQRREQARGGRQQALRYGVWAGAAAPVHPVSTSSCLHAEVWVLQGNQSSCPILGGGGSAEGRGSLQPAPGSACTGL